MFDFSASTWILLAVNLVILIGLLFVAFKGLRESFLIKRQDRRMIFRREVDRDPDAPMDRRRPNQNDYMQDNRRDKSDRRETDGDRREGFTPGMKGYNEFD